MKNLNKLFVFLVSVLCATNNIYSSDNITDTSTSNMTNKITDMNNNKTSDKITNKIIDMNNNKTMDNDSINNKNIKNISSNELNNEAIEISCISDNKIIDKSVNKKNISNNVINNTIENIDNTSINEIDDSDTITSNFSDDENEMDDPSEDYVRNKLKRVVGFSAKKLWKECIKELNSFYFGAKNCSWKILKAYRRISQLDYEYREKFIKDLINNIKDERNSIILDTNLGEYKKGNKIKYSDLLVYAKKQLSAIYKEVNYEDFYITKDIYKNILEKANEYSKIIDELKNIINSKITNNNLIFPNNNNMFFDVDNIISKIKHNELTEFVDKNNERFYDSIRDKLNSIWEKCYGLKNYIAKYKDTFKESEVDIEKILTISEDLQEVFIKIHYRIMQIIDEILWLYANNKQIREGTYVYENLDYWSMTTLDMNKVSDQFKRYIAFFEKFIKNITCSSPFSYYGVTIAYDFIRVLRIHTIDDFKRLYDDFKDLQIDDFTYGKYGAQIVNLCKIYRNKGLFKLLTNNRISKLKREYFAIKFGDEYGKNYFEKYWKIIEDLKSGLKQSLDF